MLREESLMSATTVTPMPSNHDSTFDLRNLKILTLDVPPNVYIVKNTSKGSEYTVVMDLEICSCPAGQSGAPCKHLCAVVQEFNLTSSLVHPLLQSHNSSMKKILFEVAHGHQNVPKDWFADLSDFSSDEKCQVCRRKLLINVCNIFV
jgi:hypothetical protein